MPPFSHSRSLSADPLSGSENLWAEHLPAGLPQRRAPGSPLRAFARGLASLVLAGGLFSLPVGGGPAQATAAPTLPPVTTISSFEELWSITGPAAERDYPLRARASVHYADPEWKNVFLQIGSRVGYIMGPSGRADLLKPGTVVELVGTIRPSNRAIDWAQTTATVVPDAVFPSPFQITAESPETDWERGQIETEGLVSDQREVDPTHLRIDVVSFGRLVRVTMHLDPDEPIPMFKGAFVRLRGVATIKRDSAGKISELALWVAHPSRVKITGLVKDDIRFALATTAIENLAASPPQALVRVAGTVRSQEPGKSLTVRDATGQVKLLTLQTEPMKMGDQVEAIGRPEMGGLEPQLTESVFRPATTPAAASGPALSKLRLTEQIRELRPDDAARSYPVQLSGVVTWADPATQSFYLQDASGGVEVQLPADGSLQMPVYDAGLTVKGVTCPGEFASVVACGGYTWGEGRTFPEPRAVTFEQAMTGEEYARWIEIRGCVRSVTNQGALARLDVTTSGGEFIALLPAADLPAGLEGAVVQLRGVCAAVTNDRRQLVGLQVLVPRAEHVQVLESAPADLFATPRRSIGSLLQFRVGNTASIREQVSGVVLLHRPGQFFYLQDGPDRLLVLSRQPGVLKPGDLVDAVGFPGHEGWRLMMREAVFRRTGSGPEPAALPLPHVEAPSSDLDGALVRISGVLLNVVPKGMATRFQIQAGHTVFEAEWKGPADSLALRALQSASTVAVTGVYRVELDEYRQPRSFVLHLRTLSDLQTMRQPSWWTASRILWMTAGLLTAALLTASWGMVMSRKNRLLHQAQTALQNVNQGLEEHVRERTAELASERDLLHTLLKNSPDQIYFKDRDSRFLKCSQALADRFAVANVAVLVGRCDFDFFGEEHARRAFEDEQRIMLTGQPLISQIEREVWKDGSDRVTWALTTKVPLRDNLGGIIGTFGISKDITAIKDAEEKLETVHRQLLETSRQAGMAEVATSVLHNVGNVLNSVNVSCSLLTELARKSRCSSLTRATALLHENAHDLATFFTQDAVGLKLPDFLGKLAAKLNAEQATMLSELALLGQNIEHIKEIVAMQQNYGRVSGITEVVSVTDLVEDSLRMNAGALSRHEVKLVREFAEVPPINVEKHKVLQILVNLIRNAKYACDASGRRDKQMNVRVNSCGESVQIAVSDNGVGIPAENLTRIFSHGFTTKTEGHGYGLHGSVLCAQQMGGSLSAESGGPGLGATFFLKLPLVSQVKA